MIFSLLTHAGVWQIIQHDNFVASGDALHHTVSAYVASPTSDQHILVIFRGCCSHCDAYLQDFTYNYVVVDLWTKLIDKGKLENTVDADQSEFHIIYHGPYLLM